MYDTLFILDILATLFFAISGTLIAIKQAKLDVYGVCLVALATAVGGGTFRDILLDAHPIAWISHQEYIITVLAGVALALMMGRWMNRLRTTLIFADSAAVAFAALAGLQKSLEYEANLLTAVFLGVVTATFGGIIRDVICNEIPKILHSEIYASIILFGCVIFLGINHYFPDHNLIATIATYLVIGVIRFISVRKRWGLPPLTEGSTLKKPRIKGEKNSILERFRRLQKKGAQ
jgi:uncharacterized membrane protein YeiH